MKTGDLNSWLGVITNIGVIGGLVLVAYEIRQNSIALEQQQRLSQVEVLDGLRGAWQNWEYAIIENEDVADIWMRGNAQDDLDPLDEFRYGQLAREMFRLTAQNYVQNSTITGAPADWVIEQLRQSVRESPRRKAIFVEQLQSLRAEGNPSFASFVERIDELDPPELR